MATLTLRTFDGKDDGKEWSYMNIEIPDFGSEIIFETEKGRMQVSLLPDGIEVIAKSGRLVIRPRGSTLVRISTE